MGDARCAAPGCDAAVREAFMRRKALRVRRSRA